MSNHTNWRQCSCWSLFSLSCILIFLMVFLILNDMSMVSQQSALLDKMVNTPTVRLNCDEICSSWYSLENKEQCCDRMNTNLCVPKEQCKNQYQIKTDQTIEQIEIDKLYKIITVLFCIAIVLVTLCRKKKAGQMQESKEIRELKTQKMFNKLIQRLQLQKVIDRTLPNFQEECQIIKKKFIELYHNTHKIKSSQTQLKDKKDSNDVEFSLDEVGMNESYIGLKKKNCPNLRKQINEHVCQICIFKKINDEL